MSKPTPRLPNDLDEIDRLNARIKYLEELSEYVCQNPECGAVSASSACPKCGAPAYLTYVLECQMYEARAHVAEDELGKKDIQIASLRQQLELAGKDKNDTPHN